VRRVSVVVEQGVMLPVRDGVRLACDIYWPRAPIAGRQWPALVVRTPYDRLAADRRADSVWFAERGYAVVVQDCRGRFASEGEFRLGRGEAEDGWDTVEWVAAQPWCTGRVGTFGTSYLAWVQSALATLNPPHLSAMWVHEGVANGLLESVRQGGAFELRWMAWAFYGAATDPRADAGVRQRLAEVDLRDWLSWALPEPGQSPLRLSPTYERWYREYYTTGIAGPLWDSRGLNVERYYGEHADVPTMYSGGWYDSYTRATLRNFLGLRALKRSPQFLLMGPWTHGGQEPYHTWAGDIDLGPAAAVDLLELQRRFFDRWLKESPPADAVNDPPIRYFLMGGGSGRRRADGRLDHGGRWETSATWPPSGATTRQYFLGPGGALEAAPPTDAGSASFVYDPTHPVPTIGGNISFLKYVWPVPDHMADMPVLERLTHVAPIGGQDQVTRPGLFGARAPYGPLNARPDVLTFVTPPLTQPTTLAGSITVRLFVSTDAPDTDFTAKLVDWYPPSRDYPDGYALNIADGIRRLRFHAGYEAEQRVDPGTVIPLGIEMYPSANVFGVGHRIRLDISSSNFPRFDANPNTGAPLGEARAWRLATNRVYFGPDAPSALTLTLVEA